MATASPTQAQSDAPIVAQTPAVQVDGVSRREFLYYIWGASLVLLLGQSVAGLIWYALPRFKEGEFGGIFVFDPADVPAAGSAPVSIPSGRFHVANTVDGLVALYGVCTHLGCLPKWEESQIRFACPCHGSQFNRDGTYITGPAPRGLDRFTLTVAFSDGTVEENASTDGRPIPLNGRTITAIQIDTGDKITGPPPGGFTTA